LAQPRHLRYFLTAGLSRFEETRMADKTPDPAEGARSPKRPAPTIDLPASEVKREPGPEAAPEQPDAEPASKSWPWPRIDLDWRMLAAGFAGAALMTGALAVLWLTGLIPGRYDVAPAVDSASISALNERVGKVESATAKIPNEAGDNAMRSMGVALTALNKRNDEVAASARIMVPVSIVLFIIIPPKRFSNNADSFQP